MILPKLFVGSSTEGLNVAYAIQDNLQHDADVTVWTQGIFKLSSNALNDLLQALDGFDFAIFVFQPDDYTTMRNLQYQTVRDNVIFELGLFIGRLGCDKVFYLVPQGTESLHLPTDLIGVEPGKYNEKRTDNLTAACGPFCNSVRITLQKHIIQSMVDFKNDSPIAKKIIIDRPMYWEYKLAAELIRTGLKPITEKLEKVHNGLVVQRKHTIGYKDLSTFMFDSFANYKALGNNFNNALTELGDCLKTDGVSDAKEIKQTVNLLVSIAQALLEWEEEINSFNIVRVEIEPIPNLLKGYSQVYMKAITLMPERIENFITTFIATGKGEPISNVVFPHSGLIDATNLFMKFMKDNNISDVL